MPLETHFRRIVAFAACLTAPFAFAADNQNLTVQATVQAMCKFSSAAQTLTFGTLDPSTPGPVTGTGAAVTYKCTKGTAATGVAAGNGNFFLSGSRRMSNGTDFIPYTLTLTNGTQTGQGFGAGTDLALNVSGSVAATDYQNVSAGTYTDVVQLTITP